jgi:hypothetical protein
MDRGAKTQCSGQSRQQDCGVLFFSASHAIVAGAELVSGGSSARQRVGSTRYCWRVNVAVVLGGRSDDGRGTDCPKKKKKLHEFLAKTKAKITDIFSSSLPSPPVPLCHNSINTEKLSAAVTVGAAAALANPLVAEAAVTPSLKNTLLSGEALFFPRCVFFSSSSSLFFFLFFFFFTS